MALGCLTFNGMRFTMRLEKVSFSRPLLALQLLAHSPVLILVMPSPPQALVVVEDGRTDGLLRPVLTDNIFVYTGLQVAGIELWDAEARLFKHWPAAGILGGVIATREAGVEVGWWSFGGLEHCGCREGPGR